MLKEEDKDKLPEILKLRVREAQLIDKTCTRVLKKLQKEDRHNKEVTLVYTTVKDRALLIDDKLQVLELICTKVI